MHNPLLTLFFQILNIGVLGALASYFFYTKVLRVIYHKIQEKRDIHTTLLQDYTAITEQQQIIRRAQKTQEQEIMDLQKKVFAWKSVVQEERAYVLRAQSARDKKLNEKKVQQATNYELFQINSVVLPQAVHKAQVELQHIFESVPQESAYINTIISYLGKRDT